MALYGCLGTVLYFALKSWRGRQQTTVTRKLADMSSSVDGRAAWILDNHITGHVLIHTSKAVIHPRTNGRAAGKLTARRYVQCGRTMVLIVSFDSVHECHVVNMLRKIGK